MGAQSLRIFVRRRTAVLGVAIVFAVAAVAVAAPLIARDDPMRLSVPDRLKPPGSAHPLGTDELGRDVLTRVVYGSRLSLQIGFATVALGCSLGIAIGLVAGNWRRLDNFLMRVMDGIMAFPGIVLAIAIMAALGPRVANVIIALGVVAAPRVARVVRAQVLVVRELLYVEAARAAGAREWRILLRHVLPNCLGPVIVQGTFLFASAVIHEASLSFLGVGVPPMVPSWGNILSEGRYIIGKAPWLTIYPGVAISVTVLGLNLLGDGLRDALDPRMRDV